MTVHVGELSSEVRVQGAPPTGPAPGGAAGSEQPTWDEQVRLARMMDDCARERERTAAERFDG